MPAIISEANSASCGGVAGVSDSPAAAVWAVRFVLTALKTGFQEVRFHFSGGPYDPFVVRGESVLTRPIESALAALNQWLPVGATLRTLSGVRGLVASGVGEPATSPGGPAGTSGPAGTTGTAGETMLILDNEHARARPVVLRGARSVSVQELTPARRGLADRATERASRPHPPHRRAQQRAGGFAVAVTAVPGPAVAPAHPYRTPADDSPALGQSVRSTA